MKTPIKTMQDVAQVLNHIYSLGINFHPDDEFKDYVTSNNTPVFCNDACQIYDNAVSNCFEVCDRHNVCLYNLCFLFDGRHYDQVLCYEDDSKHTLAFKDSEPFTNSSDLGDGEYTAYYTI
jgi:hypothetical protein